MKRRLLTALFFAVPFAVFAQSESPLRKQHEQELEAAKKTPVPAVDDSDPKAEKNLPYAIALKNEAIALNLLGNSAEALARLEDAEQHAPRMLDIKMQKAIVLDYLGRHDEAGRIYDDLFQKIQGWGAERAKALKAGERLKPGPEDADMLGVSYALTKNAALNNVFRGRPEQALAQFTSIQESRSQTVGADKFADYAALWRVWLTAKIRADDGARAVTAIEVLADSLKVSTPYHEQMLRLWNGKGHWQKILEAIDKMDAGEAEKETCLAEARFFIAGYYRYVKQDEETALELLNAENERPFNGCIERIFIREELKK